MGGASDRSWGRVRGWRLLPQPLLHGSALPPSVFFFRSFGLCAGFEKPQVTFSPFISPRDKRDLCSVVPAKVPELTSLSRFWMTLEAVSKRTWLLGDLQAGPRRSEAPRPDPRSVCSARHSHSGSRFKGCTLGAPGVLGTLWTVDMIEPRYGLSINFEDSGRRRGDLLIFHPRRALKVSSLARQTCHLPPWTIACSSVGLSLAMYRASFQTDRSESCDQTLKQSLLLGEWSLLSGLARLCTAHPWRRAGHCQ